LQENINGQISGLSAFFSSAVSKFFFAFVRVDVFLSGGRAPVVRVAVGWLRSAPFGSVVGWLANCSGNFLSLQSETNKHQPKNGLAVLLSF
jgi:hypothetical protein